MIPVADQNYYGGRRFIPPEIMRRFASRSEAAKGRIGGAVLFPSPVFCGYEQRGCRSRPRWPKSFSTSMTSAQPVYASEAKAQKEEQDKKPEVRFFLLDQAKKWMND